MRSKCKVLFLCTGNSAQSQMAEAIVNARMSEEWEAASAGTEPAGYVHPFVIRAMAEIGIEHEGRSKSADEFIAFARMVVEAAARVGGATRFPLTALRDLDSPVTYSLN